MDNIEKLEREHDYVSPEIEVIEPHKDIIMFNGESTGDEPQPGF